MERTTESWDSPSDSCHCCHIYKARIQVLEEINDFHRRLNGELRELLIAWTNTSTSKPLEKE